MELSSDLFDSGAFDSGTFRHVLGHFASGVVVVTSVLDDEPVGMTAQSFSSLSLDPPWVMFCPARASTTWPKIEQAGHFAVNILSRRQEDLGRQFARSGVDRFAGVAWTPGRNGDPLLDGVLAQIECGLHACHDGGDHVIVVGDVQRLTASPDLEPLLYFRSDFGVFSAAADAD